MTAVKAAAKAAVTAAEVAVEAAATAAEAAAQAAERRLRRRRTREDAAAEAAQSSGSGGGLVTLVLEGAAMSDFGVVIPHDKFFPVCVQSKKAKKGIHCPEAAAGASGEATPALHAEPEPPAARSGISRCDDKNAAAAAIGACAKRSET